RQNTIFLGIIFLLMNVPLSYACLNVYHSVDQEGKLHQVSEIGHLFDQNFDLRLLEKQLLSLQAQYKAAPDFQLLSDYAVNLLKAGKIRPAVKILEALNRHYPNEYQLAANLGTAYELSDQLNQAWRYINRAISLNPDAHGGSEWVHRDILARTNSGRYSFASLQEGPILDLRPVHRFDSATREQILIQVRERFPFSSPPDPIMASLMISLGECYAATRSIEHAKVFFTIAEKHFGADPAITRPLIDKMLKFREEYHAVRPERTRGIETNVKITGLPMRDLIDDHQKEPYSINWEVIDTDALSLLARLNLPKIPVSELPPEEKPAKKRSGWPYLLSALFGFVAVGLSLWRVNVLLSKNKG
ncbi:MAG: hypothetical protein AAF206_26355, partial [Bacteroidota bacterium]